MPVKIRLTRRGRKNHPIYEIVVADSRTSRNGKYIEKLGLYNPNTDPAQITLNDERALYWVKTVGAQPTDTAKRILSYKGVLLKKHLQVGVDKGAITQEVADKRYEDWMKGKGEAVEGKIKSIADAKAKQIQEKTAAESIVREARAKELAEKLKKEEEATAEAEKKSDEAEEGAETSETGETTEPTEPKPEAEKKPEEKVEAEKKPEEKVEEEKKPEDKGDSNSKE